MPNAKELHKPGLVPIVHGVGRPRGFTSDMLRLLFSVYSDDEICNLEVLSYGRSSPTVEAQLAKLREGHLEEPDMKCAPFGEWWSLSADIAFDALVGHVSSPLKLDTLSAVLRPKPDGIVQASGCGAFPNYFAKDSLGFSKSPKKSDPAVISWRTETSLDIIKNYNATGRLDFRDKILWTRTLTRLAIA